MFHAPKRMAVKQKEPDEENIRPPVAEEPILDAAKMFSILHLSSEEGGLKAPCSTEVQEAGRGDRKVSGRWPHRCFL